MSESIIVALITVLPGLLATLWNITKSNKIHVLVNSKMTAALERIAQLEKIILDKTNEPLPPRKSELYIK